MKCLFCVFMCGFDAGFGLIYWRLCCGVCEYYTFACVDIVGVVTVGAS